MKLRVYRNGIFMNEFNTGHATRSFLQALANKTIHAYNTQFKYKNNYTTRQTITETIRQNTVDGVDIYKYEFVDVPINHGEVDVNQILTEYMEYMKKLEE